jgi:uncharacterized membrane protein YbhN (UPF0104 family)
VRAVSVLRERADAQATSPSFGVRSLKFGRAEFRGHPRLSIACAMALLAVAAGISAAVAGGDTGEDLGDAIGSTARTAIHLRWQFGAMVVVLAAAHYFAAAVAARAAVPHFLPFGETFLVQLSAAAANRLTPAGIGGSAMIARYYMRRAGLEIAGAAGAVVALSVLGGLADAGVLAVVLFAGQWLGLDGGTHELGLLLRQVQSTLGPVRSPWLWAAVCGLAAALVGIWFTRRRDRVADWVVGFVRPVVRLVRRPRSLLALLGASGSTTLILAFAFAACIAMVPGPRPGESMGALVVAFMIGSAAGNAVPVPAGLGATEAALVGVLASAAVPAAHAIEIVLLFRLITFWAPAGVGILTAGVLRRRGAI